MSEIQWLIAREIPRLRRYARALTRDADNADDLVQDCVERAIRKRHLWKQTGSIRNWLYRILYREFVNQSVRRKRRDRHIAEEEHPMDPLADPPQEETMSFRNVAEALYCLPSDQRAAIMLIAVEGLTYSDAATVLGIEIGTLRSRLFRGREKLKVVFSPDETKAPLRRVK